MAIDQTLRDELPGYQRRDHRISRLPATCQNDQIPPRQRILEQIADDELGHYLSGKPTPGKRSSRIVAKSGPFA